jgi:ribosomal protein S18 acetylase RimI-like enzyme
MPSSPQVVHGHDPVATERILRALPDWFGIESALLEYVHQSSLLPSLLAMSGGQVVGVLLLEHHTPFSSEIHLVAVDPAHRRQGVGRALVGEAEQVVRERGAEFFQVNTLGPSRPHAGYEETRRFYRALGFRPIVEILDYWPENPMLIQVKHLTCTPG